MSGCDSDNNDESNGNIKMLPNMPSHDKKTPGMQMSRKPIRPANATITKSKDRRHSKELKEIKLIGNASNMSEAAKNQGRALRGIVFSNLTASSVKAQPNCS